MWIILSEAWNLENSQTNLIPFQIQHDILRTWRQTAEEVLIPYLGEKRWPEETGVFLWLKKNTGKIDENCVCKNKLWGFGLNNA